MKHKSLFLIGALTFALSWFPHAIANAEPSSSAKVTYLVIYRQGPAWPQGKKVSELPLKEHGSYMLSLYAKGVMKQAGPLTDNTGGAVVLEVSSEAEAMAIVANDPAVKAGIFVHELHPWAPVGWEKYLRK
jgi:uncharacterized protein YciI